jgi:hypothetical protein
MLPSSAIPENGDALEDIFVEKAPKESSSKQNLVSGVEVRSNHLVLPHHFWIGIANKSN